MNEQMTLRIVLFQELNNEYGVSPKAIEFGASRYGRARITLTLQ